MDKLLGRGGMGEVYRAFDTEHHRTVAVKRLAPHLADDPEFQLRFGREARLAAGLRSPHVIPIHRYGEIHDQLYIDMRFVEGGDLHDLVQTSGGLAPDRAVTMLEQVAHALDDAHANGLVHRDVKPSNILLDHGVTDFCYLGDFGITRAAATSTSSNSLTRTGALLGSLAYMAPEQFDGAMTIALRRLLPHLRVLRDDHRPSALRRRRSARAHAFAHGYPSATAIRLQPGCRDLRRARRHSEWRRTLPPDMPLPANSPVLHAAPCTPAAPLPPSPP